jgi:curved DNA-binding protein CbpA
LGSLGNEPGITWYDVLGVLPGATAERVQHQHDAKVRLLRPELVAGAPSPVIAAASRAREILDAARHVLADPANRARYDETAGIRRSGGGLIPPESFPSQPGTERPDLEFIADNAGLEVLGALLLLDNWMTPHPRLPRRVAVPDLRGLFYSVCLGITGKLGFRLNTLRLTEHPMPVDGLVVGQSPWPATRARRGSELTVQVWHPPARRGHDGTRRARPAP